MSKTIDIENSCWCYNDIWSDENELKSYQVAKQSNKKYKFNCLVCNHSYEQRPYHKTSGSGCGFCSNKKLCGNLECIYCLEKSAYCYKSIWSNENKLKSYQVTKNTHKIYKFNCLKCKHVYEQEPNTKTIQGCSCPFCSNHTLCGNLECLNCLEKSAYCYNDIWSNENELKSYQVFKNSNKKIKFNCTICKHTYEKQPNSKNGCPFCSNRQLCCNLECIYCLEKSAYCYENIWNNQNIKKSYEVTMSSNKKYKFNCLECKQTYEQTLGNKTNGNRCPYCKHKTEKKIMEFLRKENIKFKHQYKFNDYTKKYDFLLIDYNLILEIDGDQHFKDNKHFKSSAETNQQNDKQKMVKCINNGISVLRIYQPDIWKDTIDWQQEIKTNLIKRKIPITIFISKNENIYDNHK